MTVEDEVVDDQRDDVVQHQRGDDLVGGEERAQDARNRREKRTACSPGEHHRGDHDRRRRTSDEEPERCAGDRAGVQLTFPADVEEPHAKGNCRRQAGEGQGRSRHDRLRQRPVGQERGVEQPPERVQRRVMRREEHDRGEQERDDDRHHRNRDRQPPGLLEPPLDAHHARSSPPAISRPSSSIVADAASRSPTIAPSYMTTIRSARAWISSRSSLISSRARPRSAADRR